VSEDAKRFFDAIARRYDRVYALGGPTSRARLARVLEAIRGRRRVLVLGVGTGRELPALLDAGHEPVGVELSSEMIALCNKRARTVPIATADFFAPLPFADASFDAAIALHGTLAHPPRATALADLARELARVLASPGVFVAEVPSSEGLAALARAPAPEGVRVTVKGPTSFVHHDAVAKVSIAGIALDAEGWRSAFAPALHVTVEALGPAELLIVALT
jgi:SAM-dependent methyltransferase